jgi:hypothetical protein
MNEPKAENVKNSGLDKKLKDSLYSSPGGNFFRLSFGIVSGMIGLALGFGFSIWYTQNPGVSILRGALLCLLFLVVGGILGAFWDNAAHKVERKDRVILAQMLKEEMEKNKEEEKKKAEAEANAENSSS